MRSQIGDFEACEGGGTLEDILVFFVGAAWALGFPGPPRELRILLCLGKSPPSENSRKDAMVAQAAQMKAAASASAAFACAARSTFVPLPAARPLMLGRLLPIFEAS